MSPARQNKRVSSLLFFLLGLTPSFLAQAASPLASLGFACGNFAKKNKRLLTVYASVTFKMASKVVVDFITEILFRFLGFGDYKVSIVIEN